MVEFFIRRPIVAMVIAILMVIMGLLALKSLPIAQYPEITPPMVSVTASYTGANAVNVEQSVATPVEQKVNGVENMIYMKSTNASDGSMKLDVSFEVGTNLDTANVLTQNRVSEAQALLPEEVKRLGVTVKKQLSFPLLLVSLISPKCTYDANYLTNYATINVLDALSRIQGVGSATVVGGSSFEYAMRVWVRPDQIAKLGITVPDITNALRRREPSSHIPCRLPVGWSRRRSSATWWCALTPTARRSSCATWRVSNSVPRAMSSRPSSTRRQRRR
jgi:HAE1 family hydrophobic/amphiphilic exporter-1